MYGCRFGRVVACPNPVLSSRCGGWCRRTVSALAMVRVQPYTYHNKPATWRGVAMRAKESQRKEIKVRWLYERLRTLIESERWPDGYLIPSQAALAEQYGISVRTARDAVTLLVEDGLALRSQGRRTRVYQPEPPHQIV